jgi:molecular chaperone DnaK
MVRDAEAHTEEDAKFEELVNLRNQANGLSHAARKMLTDAADQATDEEKEAIESAATSLDEASKTDDKERIEAAIQVLSEATSGLAQKMYANETAAGATEGDGEGSPETDDVVDAEYEEVKDDEK